MGTRSVLEGLSALLISLILISQLIHAAHGSKVWGEVAVPEDMESHAGGRRWEKYLVESDDEDFAADEASGDLGSGEDGSTTEPPPVSTSMPATIYYRALVNFTKSLRYGPQLEDIYSEEFQDISDAVVDTLESEYSKIPGNQDVSVVLIKLIDGYEFVELDVGSDFNTNDALIRSVLYSVVEEGSIGSYSTSVEGFQFRRLGVVIPRPRQCMSDEFACGDGECILLEYRCDNRADCRDMSDETGCDLQTLAPPVKTTPPVIPTTTVRPVITPRPLPPHTTPRNGIHDLPGPVKPTPSRPCRVDEAVCQSGQCILRDYLCDGERDCGDGSDELNCGTPSPCEPNEFKCRNGRCALKLWRCDGDNDCGDNSDEEYCPTKGPGDTCAPDQFICVTDRVCIPASYQCDEEADCSDRSDEYGCTPPQVTSPPEETITAVRGETVTFSCSAVGVPTPIITWRLNWGHIPASARITMSSKNGQGTLVIRDVKDADQGAYTCEAINAKGMVFGIPDGVLMIEQGPCPGGHFSIESNSRCVSCFCFGITKSCQRARRYRNQIRLRFTEEDDFKGVNVSLPSKPVSPPLTSSQILINPEMEEFQLLDLSRRFLNLESFWTLPNQFLGNKIDSYGGTLKYKVRYTLARGQTEPEDRPDVVIVGNGQKLIYRRRKPTPPNVVNQQEIQFTEENWEHESGAPVSRGDLMMTLVNLEGINIRTVYDNKMVSVGLSDIVMDTTTVEYTNQGLALSVEECRCPPGYTGLSCESCAADFERVSGGAFLGSCAGCNCNGHASTCDPVGGRCLSCQHNTEGPQCDKCRPGFFGDPTRGRPDDCKPCPCPYTETTRRFSATCFLDTDGLATCDACSPGYTGRRCEKCAAGYDGNPLQPGGKCIPSNSISKCDNRGTVSPTSRHCLCKPNVVGTLCDECKTGFFHLKQDNPDGCLQCFCMGVTKQCASSSWNREQVRAADNGQEFTLSNSANTRIISEGIILQSSSELTFRSFSEHPTDVYYWVLPERFRGDKVTSYGGELQYTVLYNPRPGSPTVQGKPDVTLQGNGIFLEHFSDITPIPGVPTTITVPFRESAWRRADGQPSTREHLLMALADTSLFMIRATYADRMTESSISNIHMDIAVPYPTGQERAAEVEDCACPPGYRGPSCQDCDVGYVRTGSGLYLGTCERCNCNGHSSECDLETGECQQCQHNTAGPHCEICKPGFYGDPKDGSPEACRPCPCPGTSPSTQFSLTCFLDTDGQPTCDNCPASYAGRRCERCAAGYSGNPLLGQPCSRNGNNNGNDCRCDPRGSASDRCDASGQCLCKMHTEGPTCSSCKLGHFHLSTAVREGCLPCFCMGVTQQCISSSYYRDLISTSFSPGNFQNFALVNRQRSTRIVTGFSVEIATDGTQLSYSRFGQLGQEALYWQLPENLQGDKYALVYKGLSLLPDGLFYWQLPQHFKGDKIGSYGGRLRYTLSYNAGVRGSPVPDADVQIIGNDITLVSYHPEQLRPRERKTFEVIFREQYWKRPDGMQATREHLMMVLADLDEILVRASYSTDMLSTSISGVSMEVAVPTPTSLSQALEVEQCGCPPGYQGLSCQDCAPGYTRTGGGLYLGHCELCDCNGHSDSCHPETGVCTSCLHNTFGQMCEQCASGFYGDPTAGTPEDCQRCACPLPDPESQFSPTCESQGSGYRCTACQPGYTGQYCERCATGYVGKPLEGTKCRPFNPSPLVVQVYPERTVVSQDSDVTLRCQVTGTPPHYFYWTRTDGRALPSSAHTQRDGKELHFSRIQPNDAGVYVCTCRDLRNANTSRAEIIVTAAPSKAIEVTVEEPKEQSVSPGSTVSFICTARSKSPAYTLVWTRQNNGKLPDRAMDFNGILTIHNVQPEDAGLYVCTGSNMFDMDEGTAHLYVAAASQTRMFYQAYEMLEGHRAPVAGVQPVATIAPPVLTVQQGQRAEFRCTVTGNPPPAIEWFGGQGNRISPNAIIQGGVLQIPTVERSDEAEYICRALNIHGEHSARAVLYVHSASLPHIQVSPQRIEVSEGEPVRLYCRAGGTPSPALTWKKLDGELPQQARTERTDIGTLVIPSAKASDAGVYLCVGTNSIGSSEGRIEVSVHSVAIAPFSVTIQPSPASVQAGKSLDLNCIVRGAPAPSITWHRSGGPLASNHQVIGPQLRILQATSSDSGEYICRASSIAGVQQATVSVSITDTSSRQQSPIISIEPHSASVIQGQSASFRCRVYSGAQPIRIEWKMANNQPLLDNVKMTQDGSVITISNTHHGNQGAYRCVASNPFGITHSIVSLLVQAPPTVSVTPQGPVRVKVGEPINLECLGMGEPRPAVSWRRVDRAQRVVLQSPVPMDSNAVMQVLAARPEDAGTYTCVARNPVGSAQKQVEVVVEGGSVVPTIPKVSVAEPMVIAVERGTATLRCIATGYPIPTITWSKLRAPLPWQHKVVNNSLVIPNLGRQDSGQYICNATNAAGTSEITIMLDVESPPYATFLPDDLTVRVGEVIRLQCLAHGTHPLQYQWSKVNGTLPTRAEVQEGTLQINLATAADSGTYKCVVKNNVGTSDSLAKVNVRSPLSVRVSPQIEVKGHGSTVEFTCSATGGAKTRIEWLKEGGSLPPNHHVDNGVLRIENLEQDNEGVYVCRATNMFGQAQDSGKLTIQALPKVMINVRTSVQTVMVGNQVEFECQAIGDPQPTVTWSKVNGRLPSHIIVQGGMLKIEQVKEADAGHYRCTATNAVGSVQSEVVLNVQSIPQIAAQPKVKEVTVGSTAVFPCMASGYPAPDIKWTKMEGNLPQSARVEDHVLTIPSVTPEHSGTYICTASNKQGKVQAFSVLTVRERVVPYFTQTPLSYLTLPTIKNAYKTFNIKITFRPDTADGMIIYNGQKKTTGADFISFGLVGGRPEFRFDVGSGMATIRFPTSIKLGEFHTVVLYRSQTQGAIVVDDHAPVNGSSQGKFQGLDLNEELHVGGYPDFAVISRTTGLKSGFVGCIRQLIIQGDEVIFKDLDQSSTGISDCPTCTDQPCQNGGVCEDSETSSYICDCPIGFTGSNCEHYSALHCHPEACGPDATCINRHNGLGYDCRCHLGKSGDKCMQGILVTSPSFNGEDSYVSYPPMTIVHNDLRMDLEFKPLDSDGLLFFSGGKKMKVEDFVSLAMVDGHVEFRFELGTGMAVLHSPEPVALGRWHRIMAERSSKDGTLRVDHQKEIKRSSPGKAQGLNIHTPMYLGGVPNMAILPKPANISRLFHGCIGELSINGKKVDISYSFTDSRNIAQCYDESPCDRMPCLHGGSCLLTGEFEYQCICRDGYEGDRCEIFKDMCLSGNPCKNGGSCSKNQCVCPLGFTGQFCEKDSPIQYSAYFHDDGYMALPKPMFPRSSPEAPETIVLEARTTSADGLILWQGVDPNGASHQLHDFNEELGEDGKSKDFVSLGLQDGHLVFSYQLGSGEASIVSEDPINDGDWHKITAVRAGRVGSIQIDGDDIVTGESGGTKVMVNTQGNIYLGGAPDIFTLTGGKFSSGVTGCIRNVMFMNARPEDQPQQPIDLQVHAEEGVHVEKCPS